MSSYVPIFSFYSYLTWPTEISVPSGLQAIHVWSNHNTTAVLLSPITASLYTLACVRALQGKGAYRKLAVSFEIFLIMQTYNRQLYGSEKEAKLDSTISHVFVHLCACVCMWNSKIYILPDGCQNFSAWGNVLLLDSQDHRSHVIFEGNYRHNSSTCQLSMKPYRHINVRL